MPYIPDAAFDLLLNYIQDNQEAIHICSAEPANYAGVAGVDLGVVLVEQFGVSLCIQISGFGVAARSDFMVS